MSEHLRSRLIDDQPSRMRSAEPSLGLDDLALLY
ncbi:Uncharacterised protein [Burkholderia pseudomallei]|nr:Uncharacterised protein [Burkholderia pseudomallei]